MRKKSARRALVVDDEPLVRWSLAETLRADGDEVVEAADARSARAAIADPGFKPDVVLLDLRLPDNDGLELLASICTTLPKTPVILMTAFGTPDVFEGAARLGAFAVIGKPFDLRGLHLLIDRAMASGRPS